MGDVWGEHKLRIGEEEAIKKQLHCDFNQLSKQVHWKVSLKSFTMQNSEWVVYYFIGYWLFLHVRPTFKLKTYFKIIAEVTLKKMTFDELSPLSTQIIFFRIIIN